MGFGYLVPMGPTVSCLGETAVRFELAVWELLFFRSARSEATLLTIVALARVRVSRIFAMLEISAVSMDSGVAALVTASDMLFK